MDFPAGCLAPQYMAKELLHAEGFSEVEYVKAVDPTPLTEGRIDLAMIFAPLVLSLLDNAAPIVFLAGVHPGCYDLFGGDNVRTVKDLKGKTVGITVARGPTHMFIASLAAYVGLDPAKDINFVIKPTAEAKRLFVEGKLDAFLGYPPDAQEFKANKVGNLLINSAVDRPWSQYYCCFLCGNREWVRANPVAAKRALRAVLKATDICAREPARAAELLVAQGYATRYDYAYQLMTELSYNAWRHFDAEDSVRFHALRLYEAGMIRSTPQKYIAQGTDWRILNELKKEMKA
jgi:NitT/TauT family transport system substrate-binding protein